MTSIVSANDDTLLNNNVSKLDQQKALRALALTEEFSLSENGEFQFNNLKVTNIKFNKDQNNIEIETQEATNGIDNVKKAVADDNKKAHKAAAYTAFASYATAVIVFKF